MPFAPARVLACGLRRGEGADESAPSRGLSSRNRLTAKRGNGSVRRDSSVFGGTTASCPGDPLQAALHVQDAAPQVEVTPFEPVSFFGAESA